MLKSYGWGGVVAHVILVSAQVLFGLDFGTSDSGLTIALLMEISVLKGLTEVLNSLLYLYCSREFVMSRINIIILRLS